MHSAFVDMDHLARDVVAEHRQRGEGSGAVVEIDELPGVYGDRALLRHVWINLIDNALKYSGTCARPLIRITCTIDNAGATFAVRDNGVGFDMRYTHKLFGVFQRLHRTDDFPGTGVGLAIVKRIVQRHGGTVRAEGALGAGATFSFTLPVLRLPDA
jgi:light-regulated signal transduction histidine kinase (bacteriophytochrome)